MRELKSSQGRRVTFLRFARLGARTSLIACGLAVALASPIARAADAGSKAYAADAGPGKAKAGGSADAGAATPGVADGSKPVLADAGSPRVDAGPVGAADAGGARTATVPDAGPSKVVTAKVQPAEVRDAGSAVLLNWLVQSGKSRPSAPADAGAPEPAYDATACAACHAGLTQHKNTHGVFIAGGCADCHFPADAAGKCGGAMPGKGWKLARPDPQLCERCHDVSGKAPMHPVIDALGCSACHDPHGSDHPNNLKLWPQEKLCYDCHDRKDDKKVVHSAVMLGECLGCHSPHAGEAAPLLKKKRDEVCFECHEQESLVPNPVKHAPAAEGRCLDCHAPHSTELPKLLRAKGKALCMRCHATDSPSGPGLPLAGMRINLGKDNVHPALAMGDCQDCHEQTHSAENASLLRKAPPDLCYGCHDRKDDMKFTHGAVKLGDCAVCHDPHVSGLPKMLRKPTSAGLCFLCHQDDVSTRAFLHKPVAEGKCSECHAPHGSKARFNLTRGEPGQLPKLEVAVKNRFMLTRGEGKAGCYSCHKTVDDVKVKHRALERYGCTACHDPHGTANPYQLIKPVNKLCQTCHPDKTDGLHATTFVAGGHVISGDFDMRRPGKVFSCASCHNPHGSDNANLFYYGLDGLEMCDACHGDKTGKHPELRDIHRNKKPGTAAGPGGARSAPIAEGLPDGGPAAGEAINFIDGGTAPTAHEPAVTPPRAQEPPPPLPKGTSAERLPRTQ